MTDTTMTTTTNMTATQIREILGKDPSLDLAVRRAGTPDGSGHATLFRWSAIGDWTYPEGEVTTDQDCGPGLYGYSIAYTLGHCHSWRGDYWTLFAGHIAADLQDKVKYSKAIVLARGDARTIRNLVREVHATGIVRVPSALMAAAKEMDEYDLRAAVATIAHDGVGLRGIGAAIALVSATRQGYHYFPAIWTELAIARALVRHGWDPDDAIIMARNGHASLPELPTPPDEPGTGSILGYWIREAHRNLRSWGYPTDRAHARGYAMAGGRRDRIDLMVRAWGGCVGIRAGASYDAQTLPAGRAVRAVKTGQRKPALPWITYLEDCDPSDRLVYHPETGACLGRISDADFKIRAKRRTMREWTKVDDKRLAKAKDSARLRAEKERVRAAKISSKIDAKLDKVKRVIVKTQLEAAEKESKIRAKLLPMGATVQVKNGRKNWRVVQERHVIVTLVDGRVGRSTVKSWQWDGQGNPPIVNVAEALTAAQIQRVTR